jgi:exonuclease VII small subunit
MKQNLILLFLCLPLFLSSEENLSSITAKAEALWEAHDNIAASKMYEHVFSPFMPAWQQARLFYNLGTIRLSQQQTVEALTLFRKINPLDLSLPSFGRYLFLNEGIAYLQYTQTLASSLPLSYDSQIIFIEQSLQAFDQAQQLDCQEQKEEQTAEDSTSFCQPSFPLDQWIRFAWSQWETLWQQKRQRWLEQSDLESLASFLQNQLQAWMNRFTASQIPEQTSWLSYFRSQAESLIPVWQALQQKEFSLSQKAAFEQAFASYSNALQAFNPSNLSSAIQEWKQGIEALRPLTFQNHKNFQQARLSYEILLLQETLTVSAIKQLQAQLDALQVEQDSSAELVQTKNHLKMSLKELQAQHFLKARFFLIAGFGSFSSLIKIKNPSPASILQQALDQVYRTLQLLFLAEIISKDLKSSDIQSILHKQQQALLTHTVPFIPSVLREQNRLFQAKNPSSYCQQSPWEQVIPFYDRGYQAAQHAQQQLTKNPLHFQALIADQEETIRNWQQALTLILHPPPSSPSTPQKWTETFNEIQEMYLEDQPQLKEQRKELHSW